MTSFLAKYVASKILGETAKNRFGQDDPYFERIPADELGQGHSKKVLKRPKALPDGISENDKKVLVKARRRAYILDMGFNICGIKFGMSSLIGIIPGIGDVLDAFMAMMVINTCRKIDGGLPKDVEWKMRFNLIMDFLVGLVPFLGDLADAVFRCNTRNVILLERYLTTQARQVVENGSQQRTQRNTLGSGSNGIHHGLPRDPPPVYDAAMGTSNAYVEATHPVAPDPARTRDGNRWSWLRFGGGGGGRNGTEADPERGMTSRNP